MAFLDNSGDIILDAVLTDTGRFRLAQGDGSFKIVKFALGDDEINYELYNGSHSNGSAYYDLEILRTPVLEAFTNNASSMKSKLISYSSNNLLYLPKILLNEISEDTKKHSTGVFLVAVDSTTRDALSAEKGLLNGYNPASTAASNNRSILLDQGLDTTAIAASLPLDSDIQENEFLFEMDNRLGTLTSKSGQTRSHSYLDDDQVAGYLVPKSDAGSTTNNIVISLPAAEDDATATSIAAETPIRGPRDVRVEIRISAKTDLTNTDYLFTTLGTTGVAYNDTQLNLTSVSTGTYRFIDSNMRVQGMTTGTTIDIPLRYIKKE